VSIVADGVSAAFLTAPDGTAVRADVKDNAYEFLVPRPRVLEQRYVVWTGGDGTPHVQPVLAVGVLRGAVCDRLAKLPRALRVTPVGYFRACAAPQVLPTPIAPTPARRDRVRRVRVRVPAFAADSPVAPIPLPAPALRPRPAPKRR
jgi:hypothetical protein